MELNALLSSNSWSGGSGYSGIGSESGCEREEQKESRSDLFIPPQPESTTAKAEAAPAPPAARSSTETGGAYADEHEVLWLPKGSSERGAQKDPESALDTAMTAHWLFGFAHRVNVLAMARLWKSLRRLERECTALDPARCVYAYLWPSGAFGGSGGDAIPADVVQPLPKTHVMDHFGDVKFKKPVDRYLFELLAGIFVTEVRVAAPFPACCGRRRQWQPTGPTNAICVNPHHHPWADLVRDRRPLPANYVQRPLERPTRVYGRYIPPLPLEGLTVKQTLPLPPPPRERQSLNASEENARAPCMEELDAKSYIWPVAPDEQECREENRRVEAMLKRVLCKGDAVDTESEQWKRKHVRYLRKKWNFLPHCRRMIAEEAAGKEERRRRIVFVTDLKLQRVQKTMGRQRKLGRHKVSLKGK